MAATVGVFDRLFPRQVDISFAGHKAALWLLGLYIALKLAMSLNSILNTAKVATGADGIPADSFPPAAAREVLTLFALTGLGQLGLALIALAALIRYRGLVSFIYFVLLGEAVARRVIVQSYAVVRTDAASVAFAINMGLLAVLALGLLLSLIRTSNWHEADLSDGASDA